jgi:hypothetical protein
LNAEIYSALLPYTIVPIQGTNGNVTIVLEGGQALEL